MMDDAGRSTRGARFRLRHDVGGRLIPDPKKQMASRRDAETQREEKEEILRSFFSPPRLCVRSVLFADPVFRGSD
jgi:hypothetical protein